ncbi:uracil-xanthine permease family protein [Kibdelosporangium phytohabitans]|uniref:Nitrate reductase n=1 Tax=Kibdelosporangium phytohabitans TaxID=860235 RepID=A0A0N9IDQ6_9PSEU|nr:solute carrier family 23 protein [Kibdelosporangium phytohabitans]ALG12870.1 nitrate reductase [Kibdelosporangium phytohabitans]MBE1464570.1 uracil-xanthine permease [Kibdelosporangium phytohabitans]
MLWSVHGDGRRVRDGELVGARERLSWPLMAGFGAQHVAAMISATIFVPAAVGLPPTTTLLFSGIGTIVFLVVTRNRVPGYLGSSFAFMAPLAAAKQHGIAAQLGAVLVAGGILIVFGIAVKALGVRLLESVLPPVVTGGLVLLIGLSMAPYAARPFQVQPGIGAVTVGAILLCIVLSRGLLARLSVLVGVGAGWVVAIATGRIESAKIDALIDAPWFGLPEFHAPELLPSVMVLSVPVVLVLVAEVVAHVKAIATSSGQDLDPSIGDALIANGISTALAGASGGTGTTAYPANTGLMIGTRVLSTAACALAAVCAIVLAFVPKVTALVDTMPPGVVGGLGIGLFGLLGMVGVRIWAQSKVDLTNPVTIMIAGAAVIAGVGDLTISIWGLELHGVAWGSLVIVVVHPVVRRLRARRDNQGPKIT